MSASVSAFLLNFCQKKQEIQAENFGLRVGVPETRSRMKKIIRVMSPKLLLSTDY